MMPAVEEGFVSLKYKHACLFVNRNYSFSDGDTNGAMGYEKPPMNAAVILPEINSYSLRTLRVI